MTAFADPAAAWAPFEPGPDRPWDLRRAAHLYRRAAFGASWGTLQQALADGPQRAVDRLVQPPGDLAAFNRSYDEYEEAATGQASEAVEPLREWWLRRMIDTPHPLLERMTLFWHGYFGVSNAKVLKGILLVRHLQTLRRHALGSFAPLLQEVTRDPAVLLSCGAAQSYKAQPNESFARAFLDGYTLGPGLATDSDVRETARAFAGCFVVRFETRFNNHEVDQGPKRILGQEGAWTRDDVPRLVLKRPEVGRSLARRLYRAFISETDEVSDEYLAPLVEALGPAYDVGRALGVLLRSDLFFSRAAYRRRVKSPVDFALNIVKGLEGVVPTRPLAQALTELGQALGQPPTVHGWEGGQAWINPYTLLGRSNLAEALLSGQPPYGAKLNPAACAKKHGQASAAAARQWLLELFLQGDVPEAVRQALEAAARGPGGDGSEQALRRCCHAVVTLPEFQLA